jgi:hypothetical protein
MAENPRKDRDWREPLRRSEVATDFGITLARIQWDIFASLTFAGTVPRANMAYGLAFRWLQELAKKCGVPYKRLLIALRGEEGEANGVSTSTVWWVGLLLATITRCNIRLNGCGKFSAVGHVSMFVNMIAPWRERNTSANALGQMRTS